MAQNSDNNKNEVDLRDVFNKLGSLVFKFFNRIEKNIIVLIIPVVLFIGIELLVIYQQKPVYRSTAFLKSNVVENKDVFLITESFNELLQSENYSLLKTDSDLAVDFSVIKRLNFYNSFDVELNKTKEKFILQQDTIQEDIPFKLELVLKSNDVENVGDFVYSYLNNNKVVKKEKQNILNNLINKKERVESDIKKIDNFEQPKLDVESKNNSYLILQESNNFVKTNQYARELFNELLEITENIELLEKEENFEVIQPFSKSNKKHFQKKLTVFGLIKKGFLGFILGYLLVLYFEKRKQKSS